MALCLLLVSLVGCGGGPATDTARAEVQRLLDRRAAAVLDHDESGYRRTGTATGFAQVRALPLADWSYRLTDLHRTGDEATADAELRYRIAGFDKAPVTAGRTLGLTRDADGDWSVTSDRPARNSAEQLWDRGAVTAVRGEHSLVLGVGQSRKTLGLYADLGDRAVPAVSRAWGTDWSGHVVVLVPQSLEAMAGLLGAPATSYRGIAAVTTGETGTGTARAPADRIIVNPEAYGVLGSVGKQVVLTHETTHVATRTHTNSGTPLWLSEGYADWVGYRDSGRTPAEAAPELARSVAAGDVPTALPANTDFGFTADSNALAQAYEGGWMACRLIEDRWGERRLGEFYRAVGANGLEAALTEVLGTSVEEFTGWWREYLLAEFG
ncbi:hypothetical protein SSP24_75280 [Streptomyces spinoverrucosus]|uniref:Uncharacterized protein n=1 Tax=Streptomyces spinoverrucosus TaxID=284043 RepID=A0A4Y3VTC7_9ACTN|nr:hypothetical protein SSP24_75280 [Streptomyces spinoverrucosus]GHB45286.1 hypothetical protein GCM10010397_13810 [Streptomyces spinoverrucosus]